MHAGLFWPCGNGRLGAEAPRDALREASGCQVFHCVTGAKCGPNANCVRALGTGRSSALLILAHFWSDRRTYARAYNR